MKTFTILGVLLLSVLTMAQNQPNFGPGLGPNGIQAAPNGLAQCGDSSHALGWTGVVFYCQAIAVTPAGVVLLAPSGPQTITGGFTLNNTGGFNGPIGNVTPNTGVFTALTLNNVATGTQCLHANSLGVVTGTGADCGAGSGLPSAPAAGYFPVSTGAGTTYTAQTPSINGVLNQTAISIGGTNYFGEAHGDLSYPSKICGVTAAGSYPPSPATGYGYAAIDICPALFTAPAPIVGGTSSRSIMGINSAIATSFPDNFNVFAINGQLASPPSYSGNQWAWYGMYHESDWNSSGTLHVSYSNFGANYNSGNGICSTCVGGHFEAIGNFYNTAITPLTSINTGLECNSGVRAGGTHSNDYCLHVLTPITGGTFTNGHVGIRIDDQTAGGAIGGALSIQIGTGNSTPSGNVDLGANAIFVESTVSGGVTISAPTTAIGNDVLRWPLLSGYLATSPCGTGKVFLTSDFTSANASGLQAITGLSCVMFTGSSNPNISFACSLTYSQAINVAGDQFGVAFTGALTNFNSWGTVATNTGATTPFTTGTAIGIVSNTPTAVVTFQPGNTGLDVADLHGTIEPSSGGTFQLYVTNGTAADVIVVKRDSYCQFF